ncbi:MAG TPA: homocysteine S-methyltransferase family protein [Polyangia bacterium]|jgi:5-methyltetrahydrofolate--homocysteine methyltransferase
MRPPFREVIERRVLLSDGAKGTGLHARGLAPGELPDGWNLTHADAVVALHREYVAAGSAVLITNSFRANRAALAGEPTLAGQVHAINRAAAANARAAGGAAGYVGGSIAMTGQLLEPLGPLGFAAARAIFREQAEGLAAGGVDFFHVETMGDLLEVKAAVLGIREAADLPIVVNLTFDESLRTLTGSPPEVVATVLEALRVDLIGANCSLGPEGILRVLAVMREVTDLPFCAQPNAGLPVMRDGQVTFPAGPAEMAGFVERYVDLGCRLIGGCCGTTPAHLAAMAAAVQRHQGPRPTAAAGPRPTRLASRHEVVAFGAGRAPILIGERINPTGRRRFAQELRDGGMAGVSAAARLQEEQGAHVLDVNVGVPDADEAALMRAATLAVGRAAPRRPLCLDSASPAALAAGLALVPGKPLVNSVSGEARSLDPVLDLAARFGAAVICLCVDEGGIPPTAEGRLAIAERVLARALAKGLRREDVVVDALTLTVAAEPARARETLRAVRLCHDRLGLSCVLGVSNVSFGLPRREPVTAAFTATAIDAGLDAVIANPAPGPVSDAVAAAALLAGRDPGARRYLARPGEGPAAAAAPVAAAPPPLAEALAGAVLDGDRAAVGPAVARALAAGWPPLDVLGRGLVPGMTEVGRRFKAGEYFLPQVLLAAEAMQEGFGRLKPALAADPAGARAARRVVLATVEADVHDIGKNIAATVLESHGFVVEDLGKNVPAAAIVARAAQGGVDAIGLSALMTTTMPRMGEVAAALAAQGLAVPLLVGGAVVTPAYAAKIGAHHCPDAMVAVDVLGRLLG